MAFEQHDRVALNSVNQSYPLPQYEVDPLAGLERKDQAIKKRIRTLRFLSRITSLILSSFIIGSLTYALVKYYLTRNHIISGNVHPWVTPTTLWPTFLLLGIAVITFFMNFITLCSYLCGVERANKTSTMASYVGYITLAVHVVVWAVGMGLFKMASAAEHDLWGYSCGSLSDQIQPEVQSYLDFGKLCTVQTGAWYSMVLEVINYALVAIILTFGLRRRSMKKELMKMRSNRMDENDMDSVELGTTYKPNGGLVRPQYSPVYPH